MTASRWFLCLVFFVASTASAGIKTNGAGFQLENDNVWFLGPQPIEYCVIGEAPTSVEPGRLDSLIAESIEDWRRFFVKHGLDRKKFVHLKNERELAMSLQFNRIDHCKKGPNVLRFVFGLFDSEILDAHEHEEGAIALNIRGIYDHDTYRNPGTIFVTDIALTEARMKHVLLHELGHVFGMPHDSVSVMDKDVATKLLDRKVPESQFGKIESASWPYRLAVGTVLDFDNGARLSFVGKSKKTWNVSFTASSTAQPVPGVLSSSALTQSENHGPRVHVIQLCSECARPSGCEKFCDSESRGETLYLDPAAHVQMLDGVFTKGATVNPAMLIHDHGYQLRTFSTETKQWGVCK